MKVKLVPNPRKHWANDVACHLKNMLLRAGHNVVYTHADVTVCIGGDGTILFSNNIGDVQGAVLGIGSHTSAICQLDRNNWRRHAVELIEKGRRERRHMAGCLLSRRRLRALNDFVVHTKDYRVLEISVWVDGREHVFEGDGIIIATATGSAAYAYSAGGKKIPPRSSRISVVPIAPYKRALRPMVLPGTARISVRCDRESAFIMDGIFLRNLRPGERVHFMQDGHITFVSRPEFRVPRSGHRAQNTRHRRG